MAGGSIVVLGELRLRPESLTWRVATGPGAGALGLQPRRNGGVFDLRAWEDQAEGRTAEGRRAMEHMLWQFSGFIGEIVRVRPLPLG